MLERIRDISRLQKLMRVFPATAILGARQCGKTTLARSLEYDHFFDLENPEHLSRFDNPQLALEELNGLIVIDEIQRKPDLFPLLRYLLDTNPNQRYLILGSASRDLIRQSSESLAGRIGYFQLGGFSLEDVGDVNWRELWLRGGFPRSYLANDEGSSIWRKNYITTYLERDIPQLGINIPAQTLRRFWIMLSHYHGQKLNFTELAGSFGISDHTVRRYLDILVGTFMVRLLMPWHNNTSKRLVKSPKLYLKDSGIFHALQTIETSDQLTAHNKLGASFEGFALELIADLIAKEDAELFFWATHAGAELDLFWQSGGKNFGAEIKYADAPKLTKSMTIAVGDLKLEKLHVIYPGKTRYKLAENVEVIPLTSICDALIF
ncbi:MAG: ATP-binding protein [Proteobacteria bacterium]|nr:ATP-binding protein [Pseudomonadota bacterium]